MPAGFTYEASFDGIRIDVLSSQIDHGRTVVPHRFPKRDGASLEDTGRDPFVCTMSFVFIDNFISQQEAAIRGITTGAADSGNYEERFLEFKLLVEDGSPRILVHPYEGAVRCRVSNFSHSADGDGQPLISCSATFIEEVSLPPVFVAGQGAQTRASSQDVRAAQVPADEALTSAGVSSTTPAEMTAEVERWEFGNEDGTEISVREVQLQMATLNNRLSAELDAFDALTDLTRFPIYKQFTILQYNMRRAAESFTTTTTRIVTINVTEPTPLRVIAARFYGAEQAERRFDEMRELNPTIRNPSLIPAGTELKAYSRTVEPRRFVG